jgi:predicted transcriptional regulator
MASSLPPLTSLQVRVLSIVKVKGPEEAGATDLDTLEENLVDDITTKEAILEALEGLVAGGYVEEKGGAWSVTDKGTVAYSEFAW